MVNDSASASAACVPVCVLFLDVSNIGFFVKTDLFVPFVKTPVAHVGVYIKLTLILGGCPKIDHMKQQTLSARHANGFTLVELMVVVVILTILAMLAQPSFKFMLDRFEANSAAEGVISAWNLARSEAMNRAGDVRMIADSACAAGRWECGWQIQANASSGTPNTVNQVAAFSRVTVASTAGSNAFTFDRMGYPTVRGIHGFFVTPRSTTSDYNNILVCIDGGGRAVKQTGVAPGTVCR